MAVRITAKVQATVPQLVRCRNCNCEFVYEMTVTGSASAETTYFHSEDQARAHAEAAARAALAGRLDQPDLCDAVPCPKCHLYQPYMCRLLKEGRYESLGCCLVYPVMAGGLALTFLAGLIKMVEGDPHRILSWVIAVGLTAFCFGTLIFKLTRRMEARYDPNRTNLTERQGIAKERAKSLEQFDQLQRERVLEAYKEYTFTVLHGGGRGGNPFAEVQPLVIEWWAPPTLFLNGGAIAVVLRGSEHITVFVPDDAKPGDVFYPRLISSNMQRFGTRLMPIRVHPDEQRLE